MEITYILDTEQGIFLRKRNDHAAEYLPHGEQSWRTIEPGCTAAAISNPVRQG